MSNGIPERERGTTDAARSGAPWGDNDAHILRIQRLGRRLFDVSCCLITFGTTPPPASGRKLEDIETAFCYSIALSNEAVVVSDARLHPGLREHRAVVGAPYFRFFAVHPIRNQEGQPVGSVSLLDYAPRGAFSEADHCLLADLAALAERELHLRQVNASQLDLQKKNKNLRRKSLVDPLIGTWNRGAIMRILGIEAARCDKAGVPLSLIVADLDHFKQINDRYGHPAGDAVLVRVASRLRSCIRPQEALGRYGGEEFLVVLPGASHQTAHAVAERMRAAVAAQPEVVAGTPLKLTISAGVASTELFPSASTEELISRADVALYRAKDSGRNCVMDALPD